MSTSGNGWLGIALRYGIAVVGCVCFNVVYARFAHGVSSPFMTFMFTIPLVAGVLPALVLGFARTRRAPRATRQAWALATASLTVASCLKGIFDIAGTASPWLLAYVVAAAAFAFTAIAAAVRADRDARRRKVIQAQDPEPFNRSRGWRAG